VLPFFEDTAELLIEKYGDNSKKALCAVLAYLSGHYKSVLGSRSLLTGQEKCVTFEMKFDQPFNTVSFVWSILRRALPEAIVTSIKGMRMFKDQTGVVFDVPDEFIQRFEDVFTHMQE
jgi:ATP-dependent RNA helicase DDX21